MYPSFTANPSMIRIASLPAESASIMPLKAFGLNSSYNVQFYGPSVKCAPANQTQLQSFETKQSKFGSGVPSIFFEPSIDQLNRSVGCGSSALIFSAWEVTETFFDADIFLVNSTTGTSISTSTYGLFSANENSLAMYGNVTGIEVFELWAQSFDHRIVCSMVNMSYDIHINFSDGEQSVVYNNLTVISTWNPGNVFTGAENVTVARLNEDSAFIAHSKALSSTLAGNLTFGIGFDSPIDLEFFDRSSNILFTGLAACPEIAQNPVLQAASTAFSPRLPIPLDETAVGSVFASFDPRSCRNGSLPRAIEDLANNITVSLLGSSFLTTNTTRPVTITTY